MGVSSSSTYMITVAALTVAILYLAWRSGQIQSEVHSIRESLEATVSLHEIEEQILPTIDGLEQDIVSLKREMHLRHQARIHRKEPDQESTKHSPDVPSDAFPDISLLMGVHSLIGGAYPNPSGCSTNAAGVSTARVLLSNTPPAPRLEESGLIKLVSENISEESENDDDIETQSKN